VKSKLRLRVLLPTAILALMGIGVGAFAFSGTPGGDAPLPPIQRPAAGPPAAAAPGSGATLASWVKKANKICANVDREAAALGTPQTREQLLVTLPQSLTLAEEGLQELTTVPAPKRQAAQIARMLSLFTQFVAKEREAVAALEAGSAETFAQLTGAAFRLNDRGNRIARQLGALRCAEDGSDDTALARERKRHRVVVAVLYAPDAAVDTLTIREARAGAAAAGAGFVAINVYDAQEIAPVTIALPIRVTPAVVVYNRTDGPVNVFGSYVDEETVAQAAANAAL
jgi:hypothetical protein